MDIKLLLKDKVDLSESSLDSVKEMYREFYKIINGEEIVDTIIKLSPNSFKKGELLKNTGLNHLCALKTLGSVNDNKYYKLGLLISNNEVCSVGRIILDDSKIAHICEIATYDDDKYHKYLVYHMFINEVYNLCKKEGYESIDLEVPIRDVDLLKTASVNGFTLVEGENDITSNIQTYLLNKNIERSKDFEPNFTRKQKK